MNKYTLKHIKRSLDIKNSIDFNIDEDSHIIAITIKNLKLVLTYKKIRLFFYYLINNFESFYFITISGLPYCFMPDAEEHIIYPKIKNYNYRRLSFCKNCKFLPGCPGIPLKHLCNIKVAKLKKLLHPIPDIPREIVIEINKICNLKCNICFAGGKHQELENSNKKIKNIIDNAYSLGIKNIRFTGGEPLLNKNIIELLKYTKEKGFYVLLNTNATLLNLQNISELEKYVDNILISIQGYDYITEHKLTNRGDLLKNKLDNIAKLRQSKIPVLRIGTIISKFLITNPKKYYNLIKKTGVDNWELYRPMIHRTLLDKYPEFNITPQETILLLKFIHKVKLTGINTNIANSLPFCLVKNDKIKYFNLLGSRYDDGHTRLIFDAQGFFKPSYFINKNLGIKIKQAWNNPFLKRLRSCSYLPKKCLRCNDVKWCLGGSRFWAKEQLGTYFAQDPWMKMR